MTLPEDNAPEVRTVGADCHVEAERVTLREDAFHVMHLDLDGRAYEDVRAVRLFPLSGKSGHVSFLDSEDREICLLARPDRLDDKSRNVLEHALEAMYYMPEIIRIDSITEKAGVSRWQVQTDCGYAVFEVAAREQIRRLGGGRYVLHDADGNRFEIPDAAALDERSQKLLQSET